MTPDAVDRLGLARAEADDTQLWLEFKGAAGRGYRLDCNFTNNPQVHLMEYVDGKVVRSARSNPIAGNLNHSISSSSRARKIKIWFQTNKSTDWSQCKLTPS